MDKLNPNELDAIFKEGADNYEFEYNEAAWANMEAKLDKQERRRRVLWFFPVGMLALLLLAVLWNYAGEQKAASIVEELSVASTITETAASNTDRTDETSSSQTIDIEEEPVGKSVPTVSNQPEAAESPTSKQVAVEVANTANTSDVSILTNYPTAAASNITEGNVDNLPSDNGTYATSLSREETKSSVTSETLSATEILAPSISGRALPTSLSSIGGVSLTELVTAKRTVNGLPLTDIDTPELDTHCTSRESTYLMTVYAAPEWSSIGLLTTPDTGWKIGLTTGIGLGKYLELTSGIGVSKKVYTAEDPSYQVEGGWAAGLKPMTMSSKGYIIDVPLDLTFYMNGRQCNGLFATAGLSSYFMSSEWYGFEYDPADRAFLITSGMEPLEEVFDKNLNKHIFGVANLSVGYQATMSNGSHIQVAPYLQLPLTGIGSGRVDLYTTGIKLGIKLSK